jgi:hypothetical protein
MRLAGRRGAVAAGDENVDLATDLRGCCDRIECGGLQALVVVFGNNEDGHLDHLGFVLEFIDEFGDVGNLDACRALGRLADLEGPSGAGVTSTPRSAGLTVSSGFFLAFMMFGSVA